MHLVHIQYKLVLVDNLELKVVPQSLIPETAVGGGKGGKGTPGGTVDLAVQVVDKVVEQVKRKWSNLALDQLNKVIQVEMEAAVVEWQVAVVVPHAGGNAATPPGGGPGGDGVRLPADFRDPRQAPSDATNALPYQRGGGLGTPGPAVHTMLLVVAEAAWSPSYGSVAVLEVLAVVVEVLLVVLLRLMVLVVFKTLVVVEVDQVILKVH